MSTLFVVALTITATFSATWLGLRWWERRTQRLITRLQSEAWRSWTDEWGKEDDR